MKNRGLFAKIIIFVLIFLIYLPTLSSGKLFVRRKSFITPTGANEFMPGEIVVKFKPMAAMAEIAKINSNYRTSVLCTSPYARFKRIKIPPDKTVWEMVKLYRKNPLVEYAEPNYIDHICWIPNDELYPLQWHFSQINMSSAWDIEQGGDRNVIVAVLDTGVAYEDYETYQKAPDLAGTNFISGYDFVNNDSHPNDDNGHGTHVTGTIAQTTNNNIGVAGIAFNCSIMPVKVLDEQGNGSATSFADGVHYAIDHGAKVINYSVGGPDSVTKYNAVKYAYDHGVIIVAATGNENSSSILYPSAYDECIAVGAVRYDKARAPYSNYGTGIELMAPGGDTSVDQNSDGYVDGVLQQTFSGGDPTNFGYWFWQGTSMATPHITGVIALMLSHGTSGTENIRDILHSTAEDLGNPGYDTEYGYGLVDAAAALSSVINPPSIVHTAVTSSTKGNPISISADITDDSGVSSATLYYRKGGQGSYTSISMNSSGSTYTAIIPGSVVTERGIEHYIKAKGIDKSVATSPRTNASSSPYCISVNFSSLSFPSSTYQEKWQMISVPAELDNAGADAVLKDNLGEQDNTVWKLYRWNTITGEYDCYPDIVSSFTPGEAFWLITRDSKSLDVEGGMSVDTSGDYAISLLVGWSQIGCPFPFNVDWNNVKVKKDSETVSIEQAQTNGWVRDKIWYWNGSDYEFSEAPSGILEPWKGYWVKALVNCQLLIPPLETGESKSALASSISRASQKFLQIRAKVKDSDIKDSYNFIGLSDKAMVGYDKEDVEEAPSIGSYVSLFFPHQDWDKDSGSYTKIILEWNNTEAIPQSCYLYLTDENENVLADMRKKDSYSFISKTGEDSFKIVATADPIPSPEDLTLTEVYNYPNPANTATNIHLKLGAGANLTIKIYTISGELVKTLVNSKSYSAGEYSKPWKLNNEQGEKVARGIYILLVKAINSAKSLTKTNKIAVIK